MRAGFKRVTAVCGALCLGIVAATIQVQDAAAQLYAGKQIRMVIGSGAGGGYDTYARMLVRHLARHIPGNPAIVNQNMPSAAGMAATNWAYSAAAPRDGTAILATYNSLLAEPLYGNSAARFDPLKFETVGSISKQQNICATWHTSPIKSIEQAKARELTVAATGTTGNSASLPRILNATLGTKFKVIAGYGTTEQRLAVERGEVDGVCGLSWSTLKAASPDWITKKSINVLIQTGAKPQADLPDVPLLLNLVSNADDKKVIELLSFRAGDGPAVPDAAGNAEGDGRGNPPRFRCDVEGPTIPCRGEKTFLEVDPVTGEEMERCSGAPTPRRSRSCGARPSSSEVRSD